MTDRSRERPSSRSIPERRRLVSPVRPDRRRRRRRGTPGGAKSRWATRSRRLRPTRQRVRSIVHADHSGPPAHAGLLLAVPNAIPRTRPSSSRRSPEIASWKSRQPPANVTVFIPSWVVRLVVRTIDSAPCTTSSVTLSSMLASAGRASTQRGATRNSCTARSPAWPWPRELHAEHSVRWTTGGLPEHKAALLDERVIRDQGAAVRRRTKSTFQQVWPSPIRSGGSLDRGRGPRRSPALGLLRLVFS